MLVPAVRLSAAFEMGREGPWVIRKLFDNIYHHNHIKKQIVVYFRIYFKIRKWLDESNLKVSFHLLFSLM